MPEINNPVVYNDAIKLIVHEKSAQIGETFNYTNWGDDDLQPTRVFIRNFYRNEQKAFCAYCRKDLSLQSASNCHVEHIVPKSKHIEFIFEPKNLCVICADCNTIKREQETLRTIEDTLTLSRGQERKVYPRISDGFKIIHPHFDNYTEHIIIYNGLYFDLTDKGHFTIGACRLNRRLREFGWEEIFYTEADIVDLMTTFIESKNIIKRVEVLRLLKNISMALG